MTSPKEISEIRYELHLATDLHIGSGVGLPGVIDEFVVRDHADFALAPFSEIKGIVRDNCVRLMQFLDCYDSQNERKHVCEGQDRLVHAERFGGAAPEGLCGLRPGEPPGLCVLCCIFGSPATPGSWWFSPATYPEDSYREVILRFAGRQSSGSPNAPARRDSATSAHAAIDRGTKRAAEDHLFNLEVVRAPESFPGTDPDKAQEMDFAWEGHILRRPPLSRACPACPDDELLGWLLAALLFTRRIGGRRRRGWGRCRFVITTPEPETLIDTWLDRLQGAAKLRGANDPTGGGPCPPTS